MQLAEYIAQTGWAGCGVGNRECQALCLIRPVVGVLPQNHNPDVFRANQLQRFEYVFRKNSGTVLKPLSQKRI